MKYLLPLIILINLAWTDGGVLPPSSGPTGDYEIYSSDQVAIIKILPDSEELSILVKTQWFDNYNGFAWIVPLPALPEVSEVDIDLFTDCAYLTAPRRPSGGCEGPFGTDDIYYGEEGTAGDDYYYVVEMDSIQAFMGPPPKSGNIFGKVFSLFSNKKNRQKVLTDSEILAVARNFNADYVIVGIIEKFTYKRTGGGEPMIGGYKSYTAQVQVDQIRVLNVFNGTVLAVVHDRYFIQQFATELWTLDVSGLHKQVLIDF